MTSRINEVFNELCMQVESNVRIGKICDVHHSMVGKIRLGKRNASLEQLSALCKYLNATAHITLNPDTVKVTDSERLTNFN